MWGGRRIKPRWDCDQGQAKSGSVVGECIRPRTGAAAGGQLLLLLLVVDGGETRPPETHLAPPHTNNPRTPWASPLTPLGRLPACSQGQADPGAEHCSWGRVCPPACCCCPCFLCFPGWCYTAAAAQPAPACLTTTLVQEEHPGGVHLPDHSIRNCSNMVWPVWTAFLRVFGDLCRHRQHQPLAFCSFARVWVGMGGDESAAEAMLEVIVKHRSEASGGKVSSGETILTAP